MSHHEFSFNLNGGNEPAPEVNNDLWFAAHTEPAESKAGRFVGLSAAVHALLAAGIMTMSAPLFEMPKTETVTFEITDSSGAPFAAAPVLPAAPAAPAEPVAAAPVVQETPSSPAPEDVVVAKPAPAKAAPAPKAAAAPKIAKAAPAPAQPLATVSPVEIPASVDDLKGAELDESQFEAKTVGQLEDGDLTQGFAKVDEDNAKGLAQLKNEIGRDADANAQNDLNALNEMDQRNKAQAAALAAQADALNKRNAQALADARAGELAAAQKAEQARAAREAAAKAAAAQAAAAAAAQAKAQAGNGGSGGGGASGTPTGVRSIEQLQQMPGNPRPAYTAAERMAKQQGEVTFLAYIGRDGTPSGFRQTRSTGHANLDQKTLDALKRWKFRPGQEGWVEIPIRWDLRGGAQETSALARRKISRN